MAEDYLLGLKMRGRQERKAFVLAFLQSPCLPLV